MKDYNLMVEYKYLKQHAPAGVYVLPSYDDLRVLHGVLFVHSGLYRNAILKFRVDLPDDYPADNACPAVTFFSRVYHPFVHEKSGALDMSPKFRTWTAGKDYIVLVLSYVKKIFYLKDFSAYGRRASGAGADGDARRTALRGTAFNEDARDLYARDRERFIDEVERCVQESIEKQYVNEPGSSLRFTEYRPQHAAFRERILRKALISAGLTSSHIPDR